MIVWIALTAIFMSNPFRFYPSMLDGVYDETSEASVVGRLARAAADGFFRNTDIGSNANLEYPSSSPQNYQNQLKYFEHPELIHQLGLGWDPTPAISPSRAFCSRPST